MCAYQDPIWRQCMKKFGKIMVIVLALATLVGACLAFAACNDKGNNGTITMYTESGFAPYEFVSASGTYTSEVSNDGVTLTTEAEFADRVRDFDWDQMFEEMYPKDGVAEADTQMDAYMELLETLGDIKGWGKR